MSFRAEVKTPELNRQIALLKIYPEVVEKHFRKLLAKDVAMLYSRIKPKVPYKTGTAQSTFRKTVRGKGVFMQGKVGWWGKGSPMYVNVLEYGAEPHPIGYVPRLGVSFTKNRPHPGLSARGFMAAGFSALKPMVEADMQAAGDAVVKELKL